MPLLMMGFYWKVSCKLNDDESLANNYQIVPQFPLVWDFYSLLLPKDDPQWNNWVNKFIEQDSSVDN